jgi:ETC complex I subunit conserved region.
MSTNHPILKPSTPTKKRAILYAPTRHTMQSGLSKTKFWLLEFEPANTRGLDPLMQWVSNRATEMQLRLKFNTKEEALAYATKNNLEVFVQPHQTSTFKIKSYATNFAPDRVS